ncbi:MAG: pilin [Francisellaceae bacterium]|jgi:type IV pilus assembly protein PilA|nr:pilin [Francisellaceae bacterium]MBT6207716.1 pilin [Francisellaceae bacterium]MBT6537874.1 pilin [Francisellaceae bacterium]
MISKFNKAFSLIELMIVIAIIGILASIAIPAYGDYIGRAKTSELLTASGGLKTAIVEYRVVNGNFAAATTDEAIANVYGVTSPALLADNISKITINNPDTRVRLIIEGIDDLGISLVFTGSWLNNGVAWECASTGNKKFAPSSCRKDPTN